MGGGHLTVNYYQTESAVYIITPRRLCFQCHLFVSGTAEEGWSKGQGRTRQLLGSTDKGVNFFFHVL